MTRFGQGCAAQYGLVLSLRAERKSSETRKALRLFCRKGMATHGGGGGHRAALDVSSAPAGSTEAGAGDVRRAVARGGGMRSLAWKGTIAAWTLLNVATEAVAVRLGSNRCVREADDMAPPQPPAVAACHRRRGRHPTDQGCHHPYRRRASGWAVVY